MDTYAQGYVFNYAIRGHKRDAKPGEDSQDGYVAALTLTPPDGKPVELLSEPADPDGIDKVAYAAFAVLRALQADSLRRILADTSDPRAPSQAYGRDSKHG